MIKKILIRFRGAYKKTKCEYLQELFTKTYIISLKLAIGYSCYLFTNNYGTTQIRT